MYRAWEESQFGPRSGDQWLRDPRRRAKGPALAPPCLPSLPCHPAIFDFYVPCQNTGVRAGYIAHAARSGKASLQDQAQPGSIK